LNEAFSYDLYIKNKFFANLFFDIISSGKNKDHYLPINQSPFKVAIKIRNSIELTIQKFLFEPFDSLVKLQDNILVVRLLIKFLERYSIFSSDKNYEHKSGLVSKQIANWENLMSYLLEKSPHGDVDYNFLISFIRLPNGTKDLEFPPEDDEFKRDCLIFASYLNQLIQRKEFKIFKFDHPNLVFLLAFILEITDDYGNTLSEYSSLNYYYRLRSFFHMGTDPIKLLKDIQKKNARVLRKTIKKLGEEISGTNWISRLTTCFEKYFDEQPSDKNRNLLFRLKCLAIMESHQSRNFSN
jgi:hypothetical protein